MLSKTNFSQAVILSLALVSATHAQAIVKPGQPRHGIPGYFELIGNSLVSAQQVNSTRLLATGVRSPRHSSF